MILNIVYAHLRTDDIQSLRRGSVIAIWSAKPIDGCDIYLYNDAFSYTGRIKGFNVLFLSEPIIVLPGQFREDIWNEFDHIVTLYEAFTSKERNISHVLYPRLGWAHYPPVIEDKNERNFRYPLSGREQAICMIAGNKHSSVEGELYSKRLDIARWFSVNSPIEFDVYGHPPFPLPNYRGALVDGCRGTLADGSAFTKESKYRALAKYKYAVAFENIFHPKYSRGYVSEKMLDCFETRTVPIYLGCTNVDDYIPSSCFIDMRVFSGYKELSTYLMSMSESEYYRYIENIDAWVEEGHLNKFSWQGLCEQLVEIFVQRTRSDVPSDFRETKKWISIPVSEVRALLGKEIPALSRWSWAELVNGKSPFLSRDVPASLIAGIEIGQNIPAVDRLNPPHGNKTANGIEQQAVRENQGETVSMDYQAYYRKIREYYQLDESKSLLEKFVHPVWAKELDELKALLTNGLPNDFLLHRFCREMFVRTGWNAQQEYELEYINHLPDELKRDIFSLKESPIGAVPIDCKGHPISVNTLGMLWYYGRIRRHLVEHPQSVVEFGGGFGSLVRVFKILEGGGLTYSIIDLPEMLALQTYFLARSLGGDMLVCHVDHKDRPVEGKVNLYPVFAAEKLSLKTVLFLSTFALSEAPAFVQSLIGHTLNYYGAEHIYITGQLPNERVELGWEPPNGIVTSACRTRNRNEVNRFHIGNNYELLASSSSRLVQKADVEIGRLLFSKDRAMQLQATIESFMLHCRDGDVADLVVLYKTSNELHRGQYERLREKFPAVTFVEETDFRRQVLSVVERCKYVLFLVDDNIFVNPFSLRGVIAALDSQKNAIGFSLRLGKNTHYCYMLSCRQKLPAFERVGKGILGYYWPGAERDFGYPLEVSSSVYRSNEILCLLNRLDFSNPNTLESGMSQNSKSLAATFPVLLVFDESVTFCNPVNIVQSVYENNKFGVIRHYTPEQLADCFSRGMAIDVQRYIGFTPDSAHQEVELHFKPFVGWGSPHQRASAGQAPPYVSCEHKGKTLEPKFSVLMANYNNGKYISQAIESVRSQTFKDWELIIVDDCSTDDSVDIISRFLTDDRIRLIRHDTNKGYIAALKTAIAAVSTELFGILDSDDCLMAHAVETMYQHHINSPDCGLIYSQFMYCDEDLKPKQRGYCRAIPPGKTNLDVDTVSHFKTFRMQDYLKTPGYDESILYAEDKDISYKMEEVTRLKFVNECLYLYRELPHSQGNDARKRTIGKESMDKAKSAAIERRGRPLSAIEYFLKAKEEFQQGNFACAAELMDEYRGRLDYSKLPRTMGMSHKPSDVGFSVIIVTYNRPDDLKKCLESLSKQDDLDFEVVVVDNGGSEFEQVKQYVDQYVKCPVNFAPAEGRNIGVCCAKGKIVAFLDDDALVPADFVSSIKAAFRTYDIFGLRGKVLPKCNPQANKDAWCYDRGPNAFPTLCDIEGCAAFRRDIFLSVNGMDPLLFGHEGLELTYRIVKKFGALNKVIYWPFTIIYHDDASAPQAREANKRRCSLNEQYLRFKHNASIFALRETIEKAYLPEPPKVDVEMAAQAASISPATSQQMDVPVVLVVYNRPKHTLEVLKALKHHDIKNLYIFSDAPKRREHEQSVSLVRRLIHSIDWTTPKIIERGENFGNARNLISAVDCVFQEYDRLIVLEDDCVPQQFFFDFVCTCLEKYKDNPKVFGVTGHSVSVPDRLLQKYPYDLYFSPRSGSWGWATWKRAWQHYSGDLLKLVETANEKGIDPAQGGTDFPISIEQLLSGRLNDVWDVQWALSVYVNNGYYVYPTRSHIKNIGTDGSGLHCSRTDKYDGRCADEKPSRYPNDVFIDNNILENFRSYFQADGEQNRRATAFLASIGKSRRRPQIALVSTTDNRGGAARVAWTIKQGLKARGFATKMFVKEKFSPDGDVHVITNPAIDGGDEYKKQGFLYYDIKSTSPLGRNRDLVSCDVFHFHNLHGDYFNPFDLPQLTGIKPSFWTLHDMQGLTGHCAHSFDCNRWQTGCGNCPDLQTYPAVAADQTAQMWRDKRNIYRACDIEVIVPSQWLKNIVEKSILRDKKVHLIYNGIDEQIYRPYDKSAVRRQLKIPEDAVVVGFASPKGLREQYKGGDFILEAYKYLVARYPDVYFLCIGGRTENAPAERFLQIPFVTDEVALAQVYCAADLFMYPSIADNCPLIVLELMGCAIPVVSFNVGGVPELVEHGKTGFVAGYKNGGELIQLTERLITDKVCRRQLGLASLERLRAKFTLGRLLDEHIRLYEGLLDESRRKNCFAEKTAATVPAARTGDKAEYLVSAIVSTCNSEKFIRGCLDDLENQTIADKLETIVVNSGSQQNEEQIVREFQRKYDNIVYIRTEQRETVYAAWNRAARAAKGEFLTNANTDDRHRKDALEVMAKTLQANPDVALVYGDQIVTDTPNPTFDNHHAVEMAKRSEYSPQRLLFGCCVGSQPMWRKSLHERFGYFDESLTCAGDWDFWLRISAGYNFNRIPEFLGLYYRNEEGVEHGRKIHSLYERFTVGKKYGNPYISVIPLYKTKDNPLVSVWMAAYNAADYIERAIESVLIQNYRNFELIVVDDGSTDRTADIVRGFKDEAIKYFFKEHGGLASARNVQVKKSGGAFMVILDSDDMMTPDFLARHLQVFEQHPEADLVYCDDCLIDEKDKPVRIIDRPEYPDRQSLISALFRCGFPIVPFRTCVRKSVFDKIGPYDQRLVVAEDYDMMRRFVNQNLRMRRLPAALYLRRVSASSHSRHFDAAKAKSQLEAIRRFTDTFTPQELFPDVQWDKLPIEQRPLLAKCKAAVVYLAIGQEYVKTGADEYARAAYDLACSEIGECLKMDPENNQVRRLSNSIESVRGRYYQPIEQVSPVVV